MKPLARYRSFRRAALAAAALVSLAAVPPALAGAGDAPAVAIVPTRVIYPGQTISAEAIEAVKVRPGFRTVAAIAETPAQVEGKVAVRTLLPQHVIPIGFVRDPYLVEVGKPVQAIFRKGALTISATAVPLQSGSAGDVVRVRNMDTGATFLGTVMADGTVRVGGSS